MWTPSTRLKEAFFVPLEPKGNTKLFRLWTTTLNYGSDLLIYRPHTHWLLPQTYWSIDHTHTLIIFQTYRSCWPHTDYCSDLPILLTRHWLLFRLTDIVDHTLITVQTYRYCWPDTDYFSDLPILLTTHWLLLRLTGLVDHTLIIFQTYRYCWPHTDYCSDLPILLTTHWLLLRLTDIVDQTLITVSFRSGFSASQTVSCNSGLSTSACGLISPEYSVLIIIHSGHVSVC